MSPAPRHGEIHLGEQTRVEQRAVIVALRIVDRIAPAQGIEAVALAGMHLARERQAVENPANRADARRTLAGPRQLGVEESHVEGGVVNDELRIAHEIEELGANLREPGLLCELLAAESVHLERALVDVAFRIQVAMERAAGQPAIEQLHAADLDDAVILLHFETRGLGIQNDLPHRSTSLPST